MENLAGIGAALVVGLIVGYLLGGLRGRGKAEAEPPPEPEKNWWELRKTLTGTQLQILQHMEACKSATITEIQEKFSFIPDRELYYRMEQICLMEFLGRERRDGEVVYSLNADYSGTVEDDKTVMLSS